MPKVCHDKVAAKTKPDWLKIRLHNSAQWAATANMVAGHGLNTICNSGMCPNRSECWSRRTATLMILGDVCTRDCGFCATKTGRPLPPDRDEPRAVADSIRAMGLRHAVVTSVTRDDLSDRGAGHWAAVVRAVKAANPDTSLELLIPDMDGDRALIDIILAAGPDVAGHNVECVERLTPAVRSRARYRTSLDVIRHISGSGAVAKSGLMVGLGESGDEVLRTMDDLRGAGCRILTIGQYLRPTARHIEVAEWIAPEKFEWYKDEALRRGFDHVASAPLVRSSYMADRALEAVAARV